MNQPGTGEFSDEEIQYQLELEQRMYNDPSYIANARGVINFFTLVNLTKTCGKTCGSFDIENRFSEQQIGQCLGNFLD